MKWISYGPDGLLIRFAESVGEEAFSRGRALVASLENDPPAGLVEFVPAFTSVLLEFDPRIVPDPRSVARGVMARLEQAGSQAPAEEPVKTIEVIYDGPDLGRVAELNGLTVEEVCSLHSAEVYKVYMLGFSPGFPYLGDLNPRLRTPRLESPRARVPAGSVAIGGEHTGVYPVESPGGWNIIGHTESRLFDPTAEDPRLVFWLNQGDRVKFEGGVKA